MALTDYAWYVNFGNGSNTGYYAVAVWSDHTAVAGEIIRQATTPAVGSERCFICTTAGATGAVEPTWVVTRGALNTSGSAVYQEATGIAALNGDATNTPTWTAIKNTAITLGQVIKRDSGASYQICTVAGTAGNGAEPGFSDTAGTTTADNAVTWTSIGVVGNFTGWQAPHARLSNALTANWFAGPDCVYVASEHAETAAAVTMNLLPAGVGPPYWTYIYCVDKLNVPPTSANVTTGATITGSGTIDFTQSGNPTFAYVYGISWLTANTDTKNIQFSHSGGSWFVFDHCGFTINHNGATGGFIVSGGAGNIQQTTFKECSWTFGSNAAQAFKSSGGEPCKAEFIQNTLTFGANIPTTLFNPPPQFLRLIGMDLSALGSGKTLVNSSGFAVAPAHILLGGSKLGSNVAISPAMTGGACATLIDLIDCDSGATNYRHERYSAFGVQTVETTVVRTGGATDGTTPISWKIVTTSYCSWHTPFASLPISIWNDTTASNVTVTIYGIWAGGAVPNNDDIWIEASYMGSALTPIATIAILTKANNLATGAALATDTSTWGGSTTKFKMALTFSSPQPAMKGPINIVVKAAKASSTFYIDPKPVLS